MKKYVYLSFRNRTFLREVKYGRAIKGTCWKNRKFAVDGNVANYIPELDKADKNALGNLCYNLRWSRILRWRL